MPKTQDIRAAFGRAVRRLREAHSLSQEDLAYRAGLDRSYVGGVERGDRNPSLVAISKIARGLNKPLGDLFAQCDVENVPRDSRTARR